MALTIELPRELETYLGKEAARHRLATSEYVLVLIQEQLNAAEVKKEVELEEPRPFYATATPEEWERAFREWAASHDATTPPIPLEALRRENMYEDRGI
jgi:hypothetical protein